MAFLDPKQQQQDDDALPGTRLHVDLDVRVCPSCRTEVLPWHERCPDCGVVPVAPGQLPAAGVPLPHLGADPDAADPASEDGPGDAGT